MDDYLSQTELGGLFGVSSHTVGKWLTNLGLRDDLRKPTTEAFRDGLVAQRPSTQPGTYFWVWHRIKTTAILDGMQYPRAVLDPDQREHRSGDPEF